MLTTTSNEKGIQATTEQCTFTLNVRYKFESNNVFKNIEILLPTCIYYTLYHIAYFKQFQDTLQAFHFNGAHDDDGVRGDAHDDGRDGVRDGGHDDGRGDDHDDGHDGDHDDVHDHDDGDVHDHDDARDDDDGLLFQAQDCMRQSTAKCRLQQG
ncbi:hypothetical protein TNIN_337111 [Trichonephila inaurata madagascariensis]|uniref:Uncharacterized protein n=1 Tax=Trichonephila inaurata madagascariensis TaxID=2747483 RepID=A0A8X7CAU4_9ARAC|nr:hypothetical protein TNIN_337111 [Trichonephila inaurata madagascariensis]